MSLEEFVALVNLILRLRISIHRNFTIDTGIAIATQYTSLKRTTTEFAPFSDCARAILALRATTTTTTKATITSNEKHTKMIGQASSVVPPKRGVTFYVIS